MINSIRVTCEYPRVIVNRAYSKLSPALRRIHVTQPDYYLQVPCGRCSLCKARIAKEWKVRLTYEMQSTREHRHNGNMLPRVCFLTFTISEKFYTDNDSIFAPWLVKFRDNYRKKYGISPRYWAVTDRGSQFGRLHLHMLLFDPRRYNRKTKAYVSDISISELKRHSFWWFYGFVDAQWIKERGVTDYVSGYITGANLYKEEPVKHGKPICKKALQYKPKVFPSKGIGCAVVDDSFIRYVQRRDYATIDLFGYVYALPRYYFIKVTDLQAQKMGSKYWYNGVDLHGNRKVINVFRNEIVFYRQAVQKAEQLDYYTRVGFEQNRLVYDYKGSIQSRDLFLSTLRTTAPWVVPNSPRIVQNGLDEIEWDIPPIVERPIEYSIRKTYFDWFSLHYDYELNFCPF